ncbi:poly polymerase and DNA-ligase Zn-finger region-domain-containing protein, partial [Pavlovales sp. CCMP2436]
MSDDGGEDVRPPGSRICEYAKSGKAQCKTCKEKVGKDELRVGVVSYKEEVQMTAWYHPACTPKKKGGLQPHALLASHMPLTDAPAEEPASDVYGYDELQQKDQVVIDKLCAGELHAPKKAKLSKDDPPTDDPNSAEAGFSAAFEKYVGLNIDGLKSWLDVNLQPKT